VTSSEEGTIVLRYSFLPSDFNPMVLMLGEAQDMRVLSKLLESFAQSAGEMNLGRAKGFAPSDTQITLTGAENERLGMRLLSPQQKILCWVLDSSTAMLFAEMVHGLGEPNQKSGSQKLLCGCYPEIPVKVSRGEFTDDYLIFGQSALKSGWPTKGSE
jgi:hypothetical protein